MEEITAFNARFLAGHPGKCDEGVVIGLFPARDLGAFLPPPSMLEVIQAVQKAVHTMRAHGMTSWNAEKSAEREAVSHACG